MARVLVIDDSATEVRALSVMLESGGHIALAASSAEEGLEVAKREHPDAILMDIVMPGINGFQATRQLGRDEATRDIPVIVVSTKDGETDRIWGMRQGAREYLVKPVDETTLLSAVKSVLA